MSLGCICAPGYLRSGALLCTWHGSISEHFCTLTTHNRHYGQLARSNLLIERVIFERYVSGMRTKMQSMEP